jgi:hypothetical protein
MKSPFACVAKYSLNACAEKSTMKDLQMLFLQEKVPLSVLTITSAIYGLL